MEQFKSHFCTVIPSTTTKPNNGMIGKFNFDAFKPTGEIIVRVGQNSDREEREYVNMDTDESK